MKLKITMLFLFVLQLSYGQVTNQGKPASWAIITKAKEMRAEVMPSIDLEKLQAEDKINDVGKNKPWRYGYEFLVDHNLENSGVWNELDNGDRIWRIRYSSAGARTMNFLFSDFYMPKGAKVYLYANDRSDLLGAYDEAQNSERRVLGTWLVTGDDVVIEYYEPKAVKGQGKLEVFKVVHGYRSVGNYEKLPDWDLNESGDCHYDMNCDMPEINSLKNINKKAIGLIIVNGNSFCTGALINNTTNDGTPYFLTANHCAEGEDVTQWAFRFNWIRENPICGTINTGAPNSQNYYETVSGAQLRARSETTDFCLLRITANMPSTWNLVYAGWSRSETKPSSTFGIHHPSGDIMKVSRDFDAPAIYNGDNFLMWEVEQWDMGVTEGGSSGSPLFDNNGRIIGQLYGGESECSGSFPNTGYDVYGRFGQSWTGGGTNSTRLRNWLDPGNTNAQSVNYKEVGTVSLDEVVKNEIKVYPNPSNGIYNVAIEADAQYVVYGMLGQVIANGNLSFGDNTINLSGKANGIYIVKITDARGKSISQKLVKE